MSKFDWFAPIRAGSREALGEVFASHWEVLCAYATAIVRQPAAAEDVVQEVFVELWQRRHHLAPHPDARAYLFTATRNRALNYIRGQQRRQRMLSIIAPQRTSEPAADAELLADDLQRGLERCLLSLPERCREVFILQRYGGLTYAEIGIVLGIARKTVEIHMGRALELLHICLADHHLEP